MGLLINTSACKIPDFSPWDSSVIPFIRKAEPLEDCIKTNYNWSSVDGNVNCKLTNSILPYMMLMRLIRFLKNRRIS
jgi:hypothetical protein